MTLYDVFCSFKIWLENDDRTDDITAMVFQLSYNQADDSKPVPKSTAGAKWQIARTAVAAHLESRPSRMFRNIVRDAQKKYLRHDKDNFVVDQNADLDQTSTLKSGVKLNYDQED